jgi:hypothetical protein
MDKIRTAIEATNIETIREVFVEKLHEIARNTGKRGRLLHGYVPDVL